MSKPILIAEDDDHTAELLIRYFAKNGFETLRAANGNDTLEIAKSRSMSMVVLDLMMPGLDGWDVCEELRSISNVPILILSARQEEADRILGFKLGADDYVVKPFSPREVVARVHAILRRSESNAQHLSEILRVGALSLYPNNHNVCVSEIPIKLTTSEFILLKTLMTSPDRVFSRTELLDQLYQGRHAVIDRVVDVHIASIRQKVESISAQSNFITTVRGVGYRLNS